MMQVIQGIKHLTAISLTFIDITIIQENCLSFTAPHWTKVYFTTFTVGPSLTATSKVCSLKRSDFKL